MPSRLVLVHSPLVGPETWELVAPLLVERGHDVVVCDLTGTIAGGSPYHSRQAEAIAEATGSGPAVLVGHSGAGPLLASAGRMVAEPHAYVYVDAGLPTGGRSWMETVPAGLAAQVREMADPTGWLPPWSEWWREDELAGLLSDPEQRARFVASCPRLPLAMFEEIHPDAPDWQEVRSGYLLLSDAYAEQADEARRLGWPVSRLASNHLAVLADAVSVVESLCELFAQLSVTGGSEREGRPGGA